MEFQTRLIYEVLSKLTKSFKFESIGVKLRINTVYVKPLEHFSNVALINSSWLKVAGNRGAEIIDNM